VLFSSSGVFYKLIIKTFFPDLIIALGILEAECTIKLVPATKHKSAFSASS